MRNAKEQIVLALEYVGLNLSNDDHYISSFERPPVEASGSTLLLGIKRARLDRKIEGR